MYNVCQITGVTHQRCQAVHILPYNLCQNFDINNGLILRADLHMAFDNNTMLINPDTSIVTLENDIENISGKKINLTEGNRLYLRQRYLIRK